MITCYIVGLSQELNFATRQQETFALFELPSGQRFRANVPEEVAQVLVQLAIDPDTSVEMPDVRPTEPAPRLPTVVVRDNPSFVNGSAPDASPAMIFGGGAIEKASEGEPAGPVLPPPPAVKPRFMGKDEFGYPLIRAEGGVDPSSVTGSLGQGDEDGVRSL